MKHIFVCMVLVLLLSWQVAAQDSASASGIDPNTIFAEGITVLGRIPAPTQPETPDETRPTYISLENNEQAIGIRYHHLGDIDEYVPYPPSVEAFDTFYPRTDGTYLVLRLDSDDPDLVAEIVEEREGNGIRSYAFQIALNDFVRRDYGWTHRPWRPWLHKADTGFITTAPNRFTDHPIYNTRYGEVWIFDLETKTFSEPELINGLVRALPNEGTWFLMQDDEIPDHFYLMHNGTGERSSSFSLADPNPRIDTELTDGMLLETRQVEMSISPDGQRIAMTYGFRINEGDVALYYNFYTKVYDVQTDTVWDLGQTDRVDEARPHWLTNDDLLVVMNPHLYDPYTAYHATVDGYWAKLGQSEQAFNVLYDPARVVWSEDANFYSYDLATREKQVSFVGDRCGDDPWGDACGGAVLYQDAELTIVQAFRRNYDCSTMFYHTTMSDHLQTARGCVRSNEDFDIDTDRYLPLFWPIAGTHYDTGYLLDRETHQIVDYPHHPEWREWGRLDSRYTYPNQYEAAPSGQLLYVYNGIHDHNTEQFTHIFTTEWDQYHPFQWLPDDTFTVDVEGYRWYLRWDIP